jgi:hypothetical protein
MRPAAGGDMLSTTTLAMVLVVVEVEVVDKVVDVAGCATVEVIDDENSSLLRDKCLVLR